MPLAPFEKLNPRKKKYLLAAAEGEFARLPYDRVSVFEIASSAGISRSSFYYYFSDKEDLYHYLLSQIRDELLDSLPREIDLEDFPTLLLDFFAAQRDTERGPFIARLLERAQMWSQDGFASMRAPIPPAQDRIRNLEQVERVDPADLQLAGFLFWECCCYRLGAYYRREITLPELHLGVKRLVSLLHYGIFGRAGEKF